MATKARHVSSRLMPLLEGHGDLVSRFIMGIVGVITRLIGVINLLITESP